MGDFDWGPILTAGISIAQGFLADDTQEFNAEQNRENLILNLQDRERGREATAANIAAQIAAQKEIAEAGIAASADAVKKKILGQGILDRGQDEGAARLARMQSFANKPERFNAAANNLAALLAR